MKSKLIIAVLFFLAALSAFGQEGYGPSYTTYFTGKAEVEGARFFYNTTLKYRLHDAGYGDSPSAIQLRFVNTTITDIIYDGKRASEFLDNVSFPMKVDFEADFDGQVAIKRQGVSVSLSFQMANIEDNKDGSVENLFSSYDFGKTFENKIKAAHGEDVTYKGVEPYVSGKLSNIAVLQVGQIVRGAFADKINEVEAQKKKEEAIAYVKDQIAELGVSKADLKQKKLFYRKLQSLDDGDYSYEIRQIDQALEGIAAEEASESNQAPVNTPKQSSKSKNRTSSKEKEEAEPEEAYVYLKSPFDMLNEAKKELETISDPLQRKLKQDEISFLRQASINSARANGDNIRATELSIEQDNANWDRVSESAGNLLGGLLVNALQKKQDRFYAKVEAADEASKPYRRYAKFANELQTEYEASQQQIIEAFSKFQAEGINKEKQRILQYIVSAGNAIFSNRRAIGPKEHNFANQYYYIIQQKIEKAYFAKSTLHVEFSREIKNARFDLPTSRPGGTKLIHFNVRKYKLKGKVSYDYITQKEDASYDYDWGEYDQRFNTKSLKEFSREFGNYFILKSHNGNGPEFLVENLNNQHRFLGMVIPEFIDGYNESLHQSLFNSQDYSSKREALNAIWAKIDVPPAQLKGQGAKSLKTQEQAYRDFIEQTAGFYINPYTVVAEERIKEINTMIKKASGSDLAAFLMRNNRYKNVDLSQLKRLSLYAPRKKSLPDNFEILESLEGLYISSDLTSLPPSIGSLKKLRSLDLYGNSLSELPASMANLEQLDSLRLSKNKFNELPQAVLEMKNLLYLSLFMNNVSSLPNEVIDLKRLQTLDLDGNGFTELPEVVTELKTLTNLYLSGNELTRLPESIGNLENLRVLNLGQDNASGTMRNYVSDLPQSMSKLTKLYSLKLAFNNFTTVPEVVGSLENLGYLNLEGNNISSLPASLSNLKKLRTLVLPAGYQKSLKSSVRKLMKTNKTLRVEYR